MKFFHAREIIIQSFICYLIFLFFFHCVSIYVNHLIFYFISFQLAKIPFLAPKWNY